MFGNMFEASPVLNVAEIAGGPLAAPEAGEYLKEHVARGFDENLAGRMYEEHQITSAEKEAGQYDASYYHAREAADMYGSFGDVPEPRHAFAMTEAEWKASDYYHKEIKYQPDMTPTRARILHENFEKRRFREQLIATGDQSFGLGMRAMGLGAMMLGSLADPVNLVSFGSGAAVGVGRAGMAALAGMAARQALWQGVKAGAKVGIREGALGALASDALAYPDLNRKGEDFGFADVVLDMTFGAALGAGLGGAGGGLAGWLGRRRGIAQERLQGDVERLLADIENEVDSALFRPAEFDSLDNDFMGRFGENHGPADFDSLDNGFMERVGESNRFAGFDDTADNGWLENFGREVFTEPDAGGLPIPIADRLHQWQDWTADFREQLEAAGYTREQATQAGNVLGAHAEVMGQLYGMEPRAWLENRLAGFRSVEDMAGLRQAELEFGADGDTLYMAAMKRSEAADVGSFLAEARNLQVDEQKKFFHIGQAHHNGTLQNVELGSDTVRHIDRRHPGFAEHERIADVIEHGEATYIGESKYTKGPAFVYILNEGESSLAVIASPVRGGKNRPPRFVTLSAFRDSTVGIEHWLSRFDGLSSPDDAGHSLNAWGSHASLPSEDALKGHQKEAVKNFITSMNEEVKSLQIKPASHTTNTRFQLLGEQGAARLDGGDIDARGAYSQRSDGQALISLFRGKADISTVIHEGAGHFFLENLREAATMPNAPAWVRDGWREVARAIGADADPTRGIGVDAHELFARMATDYFRQGQAPSTALQSTFKKFAQWLAKIYRAITRRGDFSDMTPEVRRVMDRLLATEDDIRARAIIDQQAGVLETLFTKSRTAQSVTLSGYGTHKPGNEAYIHVESGSPAIMLEGSLQAYGYWFILVGNSSGVKLKKPVTGSTPVDLASLEANTMYVVIHMGTTSTFFLLQLNSGNTLLRA